jgi:nicotinamide mononucleotide transporter
MVRRPYDQSGNADAEARKMQSINSFAMHVLFSAWDYDVTVLEFVACATSLLGVWLGVYGTRKTWPWWAISSALYGFLFYQWGLIASAALQIVFIAAGIWGWFGWGPKGAVPAKLNRRELLMWITSLLVLWIGLAPVFASIGAAATWSDTFLLVGSIVAQVLMVLEKYEAWPLWFVVDLVGTIEYAYMNLWFTALLYFVFVLIAVKGWREWLIRANATSH